MPRMADAIEFWFLVPAIGRVFGLDLFRFFCARSSMDRILVSGTSDRGSSPFGRTILTSNYLIVRGFLFMSILSDTFSVAF
jgi:hypothetical protein